MTTERLHLRAWREEDRAPFAELNADVRVMRYFPSPLTRAESDAAVERYATHISRYGYGMWAVELRATGELIGCCGVFHRRPEEGVGAEVGWRLAARHWGQGYATEAARATVKRAFGSLGIAEVVAITVPANAESRRVMEKLGFTHDPADDFYDPALPVGHPLRPLVLYRLRAMLAGSQTHA
jgi:RimJ/RimL family protein N-acetyltransferase